MNGVSPPPATVPAPAGIATMNDKSIFGAPFIPDVNLKPKPDEMDAFLQSIGRNGGKGLNGDALLGYRRQLESAFAFGRTNLQDATRDDLHRQMISAVLRYSRFADHNLLSAMELFQYHLHTLKLKSADFSELVEFIRSAERTLSRLSKDKLTDVLRMVRLREMIDERKRIVETLKPSALPVLKELYRTARYIRGALGAAEKRCEVSLAMLSDPNVTGKKEKEIIEYIKGRPQQALRAGKIAEQNFERAEREVNLIAENLSPVLREDIDLLKGLYGALREQLRKTMRVIESRLEEVRNKKSSSIEEQHSRFSAIERAFISLSSLTFEQPERAPERSMHGDGAYEKFITKKRIEMLGYLFDVLKKDRRSRTDRRSSASRRKVNEPNFEGNQRRSVNDRRTGNNRRKEK
jgi:hypothetical protein